MHLLINRQNKLFKRGNKIKQKRSNKLIHQNRTHKECPFKEKEKSAIFW